MTKIRCLRLSIVLLLVSLVAASVTQAADLIYPLTGSTRLHAFEWRLISTPSGVGHTDYFILQKTPVFGPLAWTQEGLTLYPEDICSTRTTLQGPQTRCKVNMADRTARYCIQPCSFNYGCSACYPEPESEIIRACRLAEFDTAAFINTPVPVDCR